MVLAVLAGCRRDNSPLPPKYGDVMTDASKKHSYRPIRIPDRKGDSVLGPIAAAEQVAAAEKKEKAGEVGKIDDTSAEAAAKSFVAIVLAGDLQQLSKILVAEQADAVGKMGEGLTPLVEAAKELKLALSEKFPDDRDVSGAPLSPALVDMLGSSPAVEEVKAGTSDEEAEATITAGADNTKKTIKVALKKVEQGWRVTLPDFVAPADFDAEVKAEPGKTEAFKDLAGRIKADEFKDANAAKNEVVKAVIGKYKPAKAASPAPAPKTEAPKAQPERRKQQGPDPLEGTTGPGFVPRG